MQINNNIEENKFVEMLCRNFKRSYLQINKLNESDAEIINIPGTGINIAVTTDNISEEIEKGLYTDPYMIGWMSVIINVSDIAATGAEPLGILLNETFKEDDKKEFAEEVQRGINDACNESGFYVLGGDTNFASARQFGGVAIGLISDNNVISRKGCKEGDRVYISGYAGSGNAYALAKLKNREMKMKYLPKPRIKEGRIIRKYASCCMDTSDGVIAALDQLMRINRIGFNITNESEKYIDKEALSLSFLSNTSPLIMLAGQHGEFELVFTIPEEMNEGFIKDAESQGWKPLEIGKVSSEERLGLRDGDKFFYPDSACIRNLFSEVKGDTEKYINELLKIFNS